MLTINKCLTVPSLCTSLLLIGCAFEYAFSETWGVGSQGGDDSPLEFRVEGLN